jgi:SAM-dependent methyltransferase
MIIDYKKILQTNTDFYKNYYELTPTHHCAIKTGEHYKLLTYISYLYDDVILLDVGSGGGESAIALAQNKKNKVISYDIDENFLRTERLSKFSNIEFKSMNIHEEDNKIINSAHIIFLDIVHDGVQETIFTDNLLNINFSVYLFCDDVFCSMFPNMLKWWNSINNEKYDITDVGHSTGTGIINYSNEIIKIIK